MVIAQAASSKANKHVEVLENGIFHAFHGDEANSGNNLHKQTFGMPLHQRSVGKLPLGTWICGSGARSSSVRGSEEIVPALVTKRQITSA
jgi:hypothetical protein